MYKRILFACALLFAVASTLRAQQQPDFSGTWKLNLVKSDYGDMQGPETRTDVIEQHDGRTEQEHPDLQRRQHHAPGWYLKRTLVLRSPLLSFPGTGGFS